MTRQKLIELKFQFDSVVIEEAAQMLDIETFIPLVLQSVNSSSVVKTITDNTSDTAVGSSGTRNHELSRVVMIGDHHQLPPVIKHAVMQKYNHLDQSLLLSNDFWCSFQHKYCMILMYKLYSM